MLTRLAERNPDEYEPWSFTDLGAALAEHDVEPHKSHGVMVIRAADLTAAHARRDYRTGKDSGEPPGNRGDLPTPNSPH